MRRLAIVAVLFSTVSWGIPVVFRTIHRKWFGVQPGVYLAETALEYYYEKEVRVIVEHLVLVAQRPPKNAGIDKETGAIIPHCNGLYFDIDDLVQQVVLAPAHTKLTLNGIEVVPFLRTEHLMELASILGDFSTPLLGSPARVENIRLSLRAINNTLLMPGEIFSFNEMVGERTEDRGYRNAPIILGETVVPGVGGGICQTSTTLYNAVREAKLKIIERRIHSIAPSYIKHGMDATVAWPHTDFKFKNDSARPLIIKAEIQKWRVRVWILGREGEG